MKTLIHQDSNRLLDMSMESLHEESNAWLKELSFWQEELSFFHRLLDKRMPRLDFPSEKLSAIDKKLVDIQAAKLDKTKEDILRHEKVLSRLLQEPDFSDVQQFREEHHQLLSQIFELQDLIKYLKSEVFSMI